MRLLQLGNNANAEGYKFRYEIQKRMAYLILRINLTLPPGTGTVRYTRCRGARFLPVSGFVPPISTPSRNLSTRPGIH